MEFEGKVLRKLPEVSGTSSKGAWRKQDVIFELPSEFNRKLCVTFFGDRAEDAAELNEGEIVTVSVNVESREFNGKWYTDLKAWKVVRGAKSESASGAKPWAEKESGTGIRAGHGADFGLGTGDKTGTSRKIGAETSLGTPFDPNGDFSSAADNVDDLPF